MKITVKAITAEDVTVSDDVGIATVLPLTDNIFQTILDAVQQVIDFGADFEQASICMNSHLHESEMS